MAYKLIWSPMARDDLRDLVRFIARDNRDRAATFGLDLIRRAEMVQGFHEMGRVVPERRDPRIREIVLAPYRIIYRVTHERKLIEFVRVWHAARGEPDGL